MTSGQVNQRHLQSPCQKKKFEVGWKKWAPAFIDNFLTKLEFKKLSLWAKKLEEKSIEYLIVIGIGGSSLGAKAIRKFGIF